jgi:hypothetical protein
MDIASLQQQSSAAGPADVDMFDQTFLGPRLVRNLHVLSPSAVIVAYLAASLANVFRSKKQPPKEQKDDHGKVFRIACLALTAIVTITYVRAHLSAQ